MTKQTGGCANVKSATQEKTCLPCDIPAFCRNSYYRGKLLTERDFSDEQRFHIDKLRLHNLALHGWGVVCGLVIKPHPYCPDQRLVVEAGLAIDDCGREIRILKEDYIQLPMPVAVPPVAAGQGKANPQVGEKMESQTSPDDEVPLPENPCGDTPVPKELYVCICYSECETEFAPAPFDNCSCTTSSQKPNRVCEGYRLDITDQKPQCWDKALEAPCEFHDCAEYYREARRHCATINCVACIPLAIIHNFVPGEAVKAEQIDNWKHRRQVASTETLDHVIQCILTKLPTEELTKIEDTNWEHGRRMLCRDFMEEYIGTQERPRGFRIQFSHKVHSGAIDPRSFQALIVFRPESMSEPKHMQMAPAHVEKEHDETDWCRLHIDHGFARRHLDGRNFDLYLTLKCDVITDLHGHAVDGNYIGHRLPTGDNIQGGNFESWVRVRPRPRTV